MNVLYPVEYNSFYRLVERICFEVHMRISKSLFEKMVKACYKLLDLRNVDASIDGTGFSNTNPSHYYCDRID
ncbi:MAG: hypothetical protein AABW72_00720, partial [archaeon]